MWTLEPGAGGLGPKLPKLHAPSSRRAMHYRSRAKSAPTVTAGDEQFPHHDPLGPCPGTRPDKISSHEHWGNTRNKLLRGLLPRESVSTGPERIGSGSVAGPGPLSVTCLGPAVTISAAPRLGLYLSAFPPGPIPPAGSVGSYPSRERNISWREER